MVDTSVLTDDELLNELEFANDVDEAAALRAAAAQRGLWAAGRAIPLADRRKIAEEGGGKL